VNEFTSVWGRTHRLGLMGLVLIGFIGHKLSTATKSVQIAEEAFCAAIAGLGTFCFYRLYRTVEKTLRLTAGLDYAL